VTALLLNLALAAGRLDRTLAAECSGRTPVCSVGFWDGVRARNEGTALDRMPSNLARDVDACDMPEDFDYIHGFTVGYNARHLQLLRRFGRRAAILALVGFLLIL